MGLLDSIDQSVAKRIIAIGADMGMDKRQILTALQAGLVESNLRNVNYGDRDSLGVFQQRPSMGWGSPSQVRDVDYASRKFYSELKKRWQPGKDNGWNAQNVQRSAFPDRYTKRWNDANRLFQMFGGEAGGDKIKIDIPDPRQAQDKDTALQDVLGVEDDLSEFDDDGIETMWYDAVAKMSDEVRGQFDPNGDLFDEPGDADMDEMMSAEDYRQMMESQGTVAESAGVNDGIGLSPQDPNGAGLTPVSELLGATDSMDAIQDTQLLASERRNRQRALDQMGSGPRGQKGLPQVAGFFGSSQSIPAGLRPNAAAGARIARDMGFGGIIGGIGQRGYASDHPHGNAIDIMTGVGKQRRANGWKMANYFHANRGKHKVKYIIWDNKIASARDNWRWRPYNSTPDGNTSATALHLDHVHLSFY